MSLIMLFPILLMLPMCDGLLGIGRMQSIAVSGRLQCNGNPAGNVKVKLYDKGVFFDTKLDEGRSDSSGWFRLAGSKREISSLDPKVNIYHNCNYRGPCYKKISITIPKSFVTRGKIPKQTYDVGVLNLANKLKGESIDCFN